MKGLKGPSFKVRHKCFMVLFLQQNENHAFDGSIAIAVGSPSCDNSTLNPKPTAWLSTAVEAYITPNRLLVKTCIGYLKQPFV